MKKLFIYAAIFAAPSAFALASNEVCFYEHHNFIGQSYCYTKTAGVNGDIGFVGNANDQFSSVKVGSGINVFGYEHGSYGGAKWFYAAGTENSGFSFENDKVSSLQILDVSGPEVCFYQHAVHGGDKTCYSATGNLSIPWVGNVNDSFSSVKVPSGVTVEAYANAYYGGEKWTYTTDKPYFGNDNDQISSLKITPSSVVSEPVVQLSFNGLGSGSSPFLLGVQGVYDGAPLALALGSSTNSRYSWVKTGANQFQSVFNPAYCIGASSIGLDERVLLRTCSTSDNQKFLLAPVAFEGANQFQLRPKTNNNLCVSGPSTDTTNILVNCTNRFMSVSRLSAPFNLNTAFASATDLQAAFNEIFMNRVLNSTFGLNPKVFMNVTNDFFVGNPRLITSRYNLPYDGEFTINNSSSSSVSFNTGTTTGVFTVSPGTNVRFTYSADNQTWTRTQL
jgi:hypothetical protein